MAKPLPPHEPYRTLTPWIGFTPRERLRELSAVFLGRSRCPPTDTPPAWRTRT